MDEFSSCDPNTVDHIVTVPPNHPNILGNSSVTPALFPQQPDPAGMHFLMSRVWELTPG